MHPSDKLVSATCISIGIEYFLYRALRAGACRTVRKEIEEEDKS